MIFTKLREINNLLKNSEQIKRQIVFIYALRDDLFKDKNRTKFFDVIIPIIPIINTSNSGDMFLRLLRETDTNHSLSSNFISDISLYIDDMRLLKNIYNEYIIYKEKLNKNKKLDNNKLLAMIVYKNIFPVDFVALHYGTSIIHRVLKLEKDKLTENRINNIDNEILVLTTKIEAAKSTIINNEKELRALYINALGISV